MATLNMTMKGKINRRHICYGVLVVALALLAVWVFRRPDSYLDELRRTEAVTEGVEEAYAFSEKFFTLLGEQKSSEARRLMFDTDATLFAAILEKMAHREGLLPVHYVGCERLVHTHDPNVISVFVASEPRKVVYEAVLRKVKSGYKVLDAGPAASRIPYTAAK